MQNPSTVPGTIRIRDLPQALRPREKWLQAGAGALDNAELLALFIATGTRGHSAIDIGRDLLARHGSLAALGALSASALAGEPGMGLAKASRLAAAFELAARVSREQLADLVLDSPERIHRSYAPQLQHLPHEQVVVVAVDSRMRHLGTTIVSKGSVTESIAHPREILRPVITRGAHGFILLHNHPSGDPSPSRADCEVTKRISEAANLMQLRFIDHLIIGRPLTGRLPYHSFREAGLIP